MLSILDIDLDYFNQIPDAAKRFEQMLNWAACPVSFVVDRHNHAFARWKKKWQASNIAPSHILHVDEHHDMMSMQPRHNIANFMYHAMCTWPQCQVHWLVEFPIDSPAMWLDDETWKSLRDRFSSGSQRPAKWPKPNFISICTSPEFVVPSLTEELLAVLTNYMKEHS